MASLRTQSCLDDTNLELRLHEAVGPKVNQTPARFMQILQDTCSTAGAQNHWVQGGESRKEREECHLLVRPPYWHDQGVCMTSSRTEGALWVATRVHSINIDFDHWFDLANEICFSFYTYKSAEIKRASSSPVAFSNIIFLSFLRCACVLTLHSSPALCANNLTPLTHLSFPVTILTLCK